MRRVYAPQLAKKPKGVRCIDTRRDRRVCALLSQAVAVVKKKCTVYVHWLRQEAERILFSPALKETVQGLVTSICNCSLYSNRLIYGYIFGF